MSYEVTATRKRPQNFDELTGQEFVVSTLKNSIATGRIAHAYLFSGPRGVGKTSAARILARALNCETGPTPDPCGTCPSCMEIARGSSLDVIEIDGASNTSVNDVREIKDEVLFAPNSSRYKIYIIDEVHMLSTSAFNALLKTIEEPPPYIVFVFATTEIHKVPATIRSRCQQFNFRLIPPETMVVQLEGIVKEMEIEAENEALFWIAKEATGSLRDAYTLFDQVVSFSDRRITIEGIREKLGLVGFERINELVEVFAGGDTGESIGKIGEVLHDGVSVEQVIIDLTEFFRNLLFLKSGITRRSVLGYAPELFSEQAVSAFTAEQLEYGLEILFHLFRNIRFSLNPRYELELAVAKLTNLRSYLSNARLAGELKSLKHKLFSDGIVCDEEGQTAAAGDGDFYEEQSVQPDDAAPEPASTGHKDVPWNEIIAVIKKNKMALAANLTTVVRTELTGDTLSIYFPSAYAANSVREDIQTVAAVAQEIIGRKTTISIQTEKPAAAQPKEEMKQDEQVELVKKVFKGEIIQGG